MFLGVIDVISLLSELRDRLDKLDKIGPRGVSGVSLFRDRCSARSPDEYDYPVFKDPIA